MIVLIYISVILGLGYYVLLTKYAKWWKESEAIYCSNSITSVSIVIPFRNEAKALPSLLECIHKLKTNDLKVEIFFVDDHSTDASSDIIQAANLSLPYVILNNEKSGKKEALKLAWSQVMGDLILQTDADCIIPSSWLLTMVAAFQEETMLVSGPVSFIEEEGFFKSLVRMDFAALIAIGAAHIKAKQPMICNGANLAYRKQVIKEVELQENKASGDDVFLMQHVFQNYPEGVVFQKNKAAMVETYGPVSFKAFWNQRLRWASKNGDYAIKANTAILATVWLYNIMIIISLATFSLIGLTAGAFLIILKILAEDTFYTRFDDFFSIKGTFTNLFFGQPFHILYMAILPPLSQILSFTWKGRKAK